MMIIVIILFTTLTLKLFRKRIFQIVIIHHSKYLQKPYKIGRQIVEPVVKIHLRKYLQIQTLEIMRLMLVNYIIKKSP